MRGARASGQRVARAFLGLFTILGRLALGHGPIGALGLGRLAKGTEPGPMVPTSGVLFYCYYLSLVSIDQLAKSRIFLNVFSKDMTLGA